MLRKIIARLLPDVALRLPDKPTPLPYKKMSVFEKFKRRLFPPRMDAPRTIPAPKPLKMNPKLTAEEKRAIDEENKLLRAAEKKQRANEKELMRKANEFAGAILQTLDQSGLYFTPKAEGDRRPRIKRVGLCTPYKISNERVFIRVDSENLPHGINLEDLEQLNLLRKISFRVKKKVSVLSSYASGLWFVLDLNIDAGGIPRIVKYTDMIASRPAKFYRDNLAIPLGIGEFNTSYWISLHESPHMLIFGQTGAGKSNTENLIVCSLLQHNTSAQLRLILIDLKRVELTFYRGIPHIFRVPFKREQVEDEDLDDDDLPAEGEQLLPEVITEDWQVVVALKWALRECKRRMRIIEGKYKDVWAYNKVHETSDHLVPTAIVFDEMEAIFEDKKIAADCERYLKKLLNMARAAGIYIFIITQSPNKDVLPIGIRNNLTTRLVLKCEKYLSQTYIDTYDASEIGPKGRGYLKMGGDLVQVQTAMMTDNVIKQIVRDARAGLVTPIDALHANLDVEMVTWSVKRNNCLLDRESLAAQFNSFGLTKEAAGQWPKINNGRLFEIEGQWYKVYAGGRGAKHSMSRLLPVDAPIIPALDDAPLPEDEALSRSGVGDNGAAAA